MGGCCDLDELNAAAKNGHRRKDDDAGFDYFSVTDKIQPHSQQVKAEHDEEPASNFSGLEHVIYLQVALEMQQSVLENSATVSTEITELFLRTTSVISVFSVAKSYEGHPKKLIRNQSVTS